MADVTKQAGHSALARAERALFGLTIGVSLLVMMLEVLSRFDVRTLWDDAYIFQRYAYNLIHHGRLAWNPNGPPAYGLTAPAFLLVDVPVLLATRGKTALAALVSSLLPGLAFALLMIPLLRRATAESPRARTAASALVFVVLALSAFSDHCVSGLDTTFGMCYAAVYLLFAHRVLAAEGEGAALRGAAFFGLFGGFAFAARPELVSLALAVPAFMAVFPEKPSLRRRGIVALAATLGVFGVHLLVCRLYFGSALPLPFYAKATNLYGEGIRRAYSLAGSIELLSFLGYAWPLFIVIAIDVLASPRRFWQKSTAIDRGNLVATFAILGYAWLVVTPIMGMSQRFFYPALPGLLYASARSIMRLFAAAEEEGEAGERAFAFARPAGAVALGFALVVLFPTVVSAGKDLINAANGRIVFRFDAAKHATEKGPQGYWFRFDKFASLPDDLVIATTEVGMLSALNPGKTVIDLAGLNEPRFALAPFSADVLFEVYKPDLIYMPHPHYTEMTAAIQSSPAFAKYDAYSKAQLGTNDFGIAIRKDSKYFKQMDDLVKDKRRGAPLK